MLEEMEIQILRDVLALKEPISVTKLDQAWDQSAVRLERKGFVKITQSGSSISYALTDNGQQQLIRLGHIIKNSLREFVLPADGKLDMPKGAKILSIFERNETIYACAIVNTSSDNEVRCIRSFANSEEIPNTPTTFIGTVVIRVAGKTDCKVRHYFECDKI